MKTLLPKNSRADAWINTRIDDELRERLADISSRSGMSASDFVRRAIEQALDAADANGEIRIVIPPKKGGRK